MATDRLPLAVTMLMRLRDCEGLQPKTIATSLGMVVTKAPVSRSMVSMNVFFLPRKSVSTNRILSLGLNGLGFLGMAERKIHFRNLPFRIINKHEAFVRI